MLVPRGRSSRKVDVFGEPPAFMAGAADGELVSVSAADQHVFGRSFDGHAITAMCLVAKHSLLYTAAEDGNIRKWNTLEHTEMGLNDTHRYAPHSRCHRRAFAAPSPRRPPQPRFSRNPCTNDCTHARRLRPSRTCAIAHRSMARRRGVVNAMVWDDALQAVLSAAQDKTVRQWRLKVRSTVLSVRPFDSTVR